MLLSILSRDLARRNGRLWIRILSPFSFYFSFFLHCVFSVAISSFLANFSSLSNCRLWCKSVVYRRRNIHRWHLLAPKLYLFRYIAFAKLRYKIVWPMLVFSFLTIRCVCVFLFGFKYVRQLNMKKNTKNQSIRLTLLLLPLFCIFIDGITGDKQHLQEPQLERQSAFHLRQNGAAKLCRFISWHTWV